MNFLRKNKNQIPLVDNVFTIVDKAKKAKEKYGDNKVIDATIGSLCDENGNLVALNSLFSNFKSLDNKTHARYAQSFSGNDIFKKNIDDFFFNGVNSKLYRKIIATPGGTGAVSSTIANLANEGDIILLPNIAWSSYDLMAKEYNLISKTYPLFKNNSFDLDSLKELVIKTLKVQKQVIIIVNDPCHNPTGYSLTRAEWKELVDFLNSIPEDKQVVLLNDVAYIDYSYNLNSNKEYLSLFNNLKQNICIVIAYSCSKSFTSYGLRLGTAIIMNKNKDIVNKIFEAYEKTARSMWSNINNGAMMAISSLLENNKNIYLEEKQKYVDLLKERSNIILKEANEVNLPYYLYNFKN